MSGEGAVFFYFIFRTAFFIYFIVVILFFCIYTLFVSTSQIWGSIFMLYLN
jgi:hypothetical protein